VAQKRSISAAEIVSDIRRGMTRDAIMQKYRLTPSGLERVLKRLFDERDILSAEIARDVRSGMTDVELTKNHGISASGLPIVFEKLVSRNLMTRAELHNRHLSVEGEDRALERRRVTRYCPSITVPVYDRETESRDSCVLDICEQGVGVRGIMAKVGEIRNLVILGDELGELEPFEFEAECKWAAHRYPAYRSSAGFRITRIADADVIRLKDFIGFMRPGQALSADVTGR
jgi:hypothetical protein